MAAAAELHASYHLYTYYRSTCSARVLIAAELKGINLTHTQVDLGKSDHHEDSFKTLNPSQAVPVLAIRDLDGETNITQSIAILEYFEEIGNQNQLALLPPATRPKARAKVRELVGIIANDLFPPTNGRIAKLVRGIRDDVSDQIKFVHQVMSSAFASYESMVLHCSGRYSFEDTVTLADICLVPAVDMALGYKLDLTRYPYIKAIYGELMKIEAFKEFNWEVQKEKLEKALVV